jgi:hypothetical protein
MRVETAEPHARLRVIPPWLPVSGSDVRVPKGSTNAQGRSYRPSPTSCRAAQKYGRATSGTPLPGNVLSICQSSNVKRTRRARGPAAASDGRDVRASHFYYWRPLSNVVVNVAVAVRAAESRTVSFTVTSREVQYDLVSELVVLSTVVLVPIVQL